MAKFKVGDTVRLRSGGPVMTVVNPEASATSAFCTWWHGGTFASASFKEEALKEATPPAEDAPMPSL